MVVWRLDAEVRDLADVEGQAQVEHDGLDVQEHAAVGLERIDLQVAVGVDVRLERIDLQVTVGVDVRLERLDSEDRVGLQWLR